MSSKRVGTQTDRIFSDYSLSTASAQIRIHGGALLKRGQCDLFESSILEKFTGQYSVTRILSRPAQTDVAGYGSGHLAGA
jgi:hypothetical protein